MPKLKRISSPELIKWLLKKGFKQKPSGSTSHLTFYKGNNYCTISVKHGKKKISTGTLKAILSDKQTGMEKEYRDDFK